MQTLKNLRWRYLFLEKPAPQELKNKYGLLLGQLLYNRGLKELPQKSAEDLPPTDIVPNIEEAAEVILMGIEEKKPFLVFGDYDVDGITSTAAFSKILKRLGAEKVFSFVPERGEGYGLNPNVVEKFAKYSNGRGIIIALDNGTKEIDTIKRAKDLGLEVVIFDHHTPEEGNLPEAILVNPKIRNENPYGIKDLSTAGLVYLFALYLEEELNEPVGAQDFVDLAALGTVADVSPLSVINRIIVNLGLERLKKTSHPGLAVLLRELNRENLNENDIAFRIAPRLNAFGRMDRARLALQLLLTGQEEKAKKFVKWGEYLNKTRKYITKKAVQQILTKYRGKRVKAIVESSPHWKKGILGLIAGKATNYFGVPSIIFKVDGEKAVGSARAPEGMNILPILEELSPLMERWGGHSQAAGLTVRKEHLREFKEEFLKRVEKLKFEPPQLDIDLHLPIEHLNQNQKILEVLELLAPYGAGNPYPTFVFDTVLEDFEKTRYGYRLKFKDLSKGYFLNLDDPRIAIPHYWKGRKVRVVYSVRKLNPLEIQIEDIKPLS